MSERCEAINEDGTQCENAATRKAYVVKESCDCTTCQKMEGTTFPVCDSCAEKLPAIWALKGVIAYL